MRPYSPGATEAERIAIAEIYVSMAKKLLASIDPRTLPAMHEHYRMAEQSLQDIALDTGTLLAGAAKDNAVYMAMLAARLGNGTHGFPKDAQTAAALIRKAENLGYARAPDARARSRLKAVAQVIHRPVSRVG